MQNGAGGGKFRIMADINMIPFIDVSLVLLIIFMVMTPFLVKSQLKINLPTGKTDEASPRDDRILNIQVDKTGAVYINGKNVPVATLDESLKAAIPNPTTQSVMIEADKDVSFEHVIVVLGSVKKLGVTKLGISVIRERDGAQKGSRRK